MFSSRSVTGSDEGLFSGDSTAMLVVPVNFIERRFVGAFAFFFTVTSPTLFSSTDFWSIWGRYSFVNSSGARNHTISSHNMANPQVPTRITFRYRISGLKCMRGDCLRRSSLPEDIPFGVESAIPIYGFLFAYNLSRFSTDGSDSYVTACICELDLVMMFYLRAN